MSVTARWQWLGCTCFVLTLFGLGAAGVLAEEPSRGATNHWNIPMKTLGGRQYWGDVLFFHGWRIQKNVLTGHYRLLDEDDYRHAWGTLQQCQEQLEAVKTQDNLPPMSGDGVILVHGIVRSAKSFSPMRRRLQEAGYAVFGFNYPSTQVSIPEAAEYLHSVVDSLEGIETIHFVAHSMGGLVVRAYWAKHRDERIKRMVMLAVPNRGAHLADALQKVLLYKTIFGPAGQQLITDPDGFIAALPRPDCEFAIIAGGRGSQGGYNPLIPGDDDGTVAVSSTRLPGATDFLRINGLHSFLMAQQETIEATLRFLQTGDLREDGRRHPIPQSGPDR